MCFISEIFEIIDLFLYIELKNSTLLRFYFNYFDFILLRLLLFEKLYHFENFY